MARRFRLFTRVIAAADLYGRQRGIYVLRSGRLVPIAGLDFTESSNRDPAFPKGRRRLAIDVWRLVIQKYNEWVASGEFTLEQLRTIRMLLLEGLPLREVARREGASPAAISDRIERLKTKAPEFYQWWVSRNVIRRHAAYNRRYAR